MEGSIYEVPHNNKVSQIVKEKDLETLSVASTQTLKYNNKKCGKEEVFHLVQSSVESKVTKEIFEERLDALVEYHFSPYQNQIKDPNNKESIDETLASNETLALSENEELIKFKNSIIDEFDVLKSSFLTEVNSFENKYVNSYSNDVSINNYNMKLQDNINFLRQQLKSNEEIINSLLQQLSKCDDIVVPCNYK